MAGLVADKKNTLLTTNGKTADIVSAVMLVYNNDYKQVSELATNLVERDITATCYNIFCYIIDNVVYKEDPLGVQWVKTPARLLSDRIGDCKSMSIFAASCLRCLNIPHKFRFVSFDKRKEATHVYVVVPHGKSEIIIDPVVRINGKPQFNAEEKYTYKSDMNGTAIYRMSGIANTTSSEDALLLRSQVWMNNETDETLTPGKLFLYAKFDEFTEMYNIARNASERKEAFQNVGLSAMLLWAYDQTQGDFNLFKNLATICIYYFENALLDVEGIYNESNMVDYTNSLKVKALQALGNENIPQINNTELLQDILTNVASNAGIGGGWFSFSNHKAKLAERYKASAMYNIYLFIPDSEVGKYPTAVQKKRRTQARLFSWVHKTDIFHNSTTIMSYYRAGIVAQTGMSPENYLKKMQAPKVGVITAATVTLIVSIVIGLIQIIKAIWPAKDPLTENEITSGVFSTDDFPVSNTGGNTGAGSGSAITTATALPLVLLVGSFLLKK